ncbi:ferredoxin-thioredoxin reductase catalytic domain-containing protein [Desulfobaculum bizertense]|uniref:ferredoxin:thioredoxin reductase n=1 Tax=Desulfobaculum bizertense DSM 18034 TaxID=1121442 RepID=A0A1T4VF49_9BACT|nr:ferredoxin-thioredoxin reductase catalytic domain-containing protein [Desulfobaculum bizertense]UIJ37696.1 ferredoxin:thioredoxin reductase [Desulfobaculum bizertense]SKA63526.1 ferredoxin-thioredoxin reductase catalytic chain [Desulfobaculum bizertense DSM 18034]
MPSEKNVKIIKGYIQKYTQKTGTFTHPDPEVTDAVVHGLAAHMDDLGKPLCPCRFYPDKHEEIKQRTWICPCDDMQQYKYCHCMLFVAENGSPITEYLPEDHDGRLAYGEVKDPAPDKAPRCCLKK